MWKNGKFRKWTLAILTVLTFVIAGQLFFRWEISREINRNIADINGYAISYDHVSIDIFQGGYRVHDVRITKDSSRIPVPFFTATVVAFSLEWSSLLRGAIVSEVGIRTPVVNFVKGPDTKSTQTSADFSWVDLFKKLAYVPVNSIVINDGSIRYFDFHSSPKVKLMLQDGTLKATNLQNTEDLEKVLSGSAEASAKAYEGKIALSMELNTFFKSPMFRLTGTLENLDLSHLNDFLKAYGNYDVQNGLFSIYTEATTRNNRIIGSVKPLVEEINVAAWDNRNGMDMRLLRPWSTGENAAFLPAGNTAKSAPPEIRFEGKTDDPQLNLWTATGITLHNAFIEALMPSLEKSIERRENAPVIRQKTTPSSKVSAPDEKKAKKVTAFIKKLFGKKEDRTKGEDKSKKETD